MRPGHLRVAAVIAAAGLLATAALAGVVTTVAVDQADANIPAAASALAVQLVPGEYLGWYQAAAATCPGLDWTILAAVGTVESGNGADDGPSPAGAVGPMQFEPASFAGYDHPVAADPSPTPPGAVPPTPWDPVDAIWAAARLLCSAGVAADPHGALVVYNCGNPGPVCQAAAAAYVSAVMGLAASFGSGGTVSSSAGVQVAVYAQSQLGVPYRWAGETPGVAFDCSGLTQWAYARVGVTLPRVAQAQYDAGPAVPSSEPLQKGDLVFFGDGASSVAHVGISLGGNRMVDAPHSGAVVRVDTFDTTVGAVWGAERYVGATRP
jgi:cell wall-associated NlpC family hydrolase